MRKRGARFNRSSALVGIAKLIHRGRAAARAEALSRTSTQEEQHLLIIPARTSFAALRAGKATIQDLHNVSAFMNVGLVAATDMGESAAAGAIQEGIIHLCKVKDRGGPTYAMSAEQRRAIAEAVRLTDDVFCCATILELDAAHRKVLRHVGGGDLNLVSVPA